jgi:uncharacterized membrane protein (UPF0127 family)
MMRRFSHCILVFLLCACAAQEIDDGRESLLLRSPAGEQITLRVEVADTPEQHAQGLMFRERLQQDTGMLFVFEKPLVLGFWMKNTLIPLDVLFFDEQRRFVSSATMEPCIEDPCRTYDSTAAAMFALEVPAGFVSREGILVGWTMSGPGN